MLDQFSHLVMALYRGCREQPVDKYQRWAFEHLKPVLHFDSAVWLTGVLHKDHTATIHSVYTHNLPVQVVADWARVSQGRAVFTERVMRSPGVTLNCVAADEFGPELLEHSRRYRIEHLLATASLEPVSRLSELISIYRADPGDRFSEAERRFQQGIVPHLAETWRINRAHHMNLAQPSSCSASVHSALVDKKGVLHLIDPGFESLLLGEWPDWEGPALPEQFAGAVAAGAGSFLGQTFVAKFMQAGDFLMLRGRTKTQLDALSKREREIASHFASGDTYKSIAELLNLAPATVRNHLNNIYAKLGVTSKAGLIAALANQD